jgi:site-specific recombinase XerC
VAKSLAEKVLPDFVRNAISRTIEPKIHLGFDGQGVVSEKMRHERRQLYFLAVAQLWQLDFRIKKLESLAAKHVDALMAHWHKQGLVANTLHTRLSMLRVLCDWMGKTNVVKNITDYLPAEVVHRSTVATESKAWEANGVDPLAIIELAKQVDERFAVMLALQHYLGLRVKESIEIRPGTALVEDGEAIELQSGTKGGKVRRVPLDTPDQVAVMDWARRVAATGNTKRLRWTDLTWKQAQCRFYHYMRYRLGVSKKQMNVSAHGLRHGYANVSYQEKTGYPTPIEGGALGKITRDKHQMACLTVSRALGHGRIDVTTSYYGSYGHALRPQAPVKMSYALNLPA